MRIFEPCCDVWFSAFSLLDDPKTAVSMYDLLRCAREAWASDISLCSLLSLNTFVHATDELWCSCILLFVGNSVISLVSSLKVPSCEERSSLWAGPVLPSNKQSPFNSLVFHFATPSTVLPSKDMFFRNDRAASILLLGLDRREWLRSLSLPSPSQQAAITVRPNRVRMRLLLLWKTRGDCDVLHYVDDIMYVKSRAL